MVAHCSPDETDTARHNIIGSVSALCSNEQGASVEISSDLDSAKCVHATLSDEEVQHKP